MRSFIHGECYLIYDKNLCKTEAFDKKGHHMTCKVHFTENAWKYIPIVLEFSVNVDYVAMVLQQTNAIAKYFTECVRPVFSDCISCIFLTMLCFIFKKMLCEYSPLYDKLTIKIFHLHWILTVYIWNISLLHVVKEISQIGKNDKILKK